MKLSVTRVHTGMTQTLKQIQILYCIFVYFSHFFRQISLYFLVSVLGLEFEHSSSIMYQWVVLDACCMLGQASAHLYH